MSINSTSGAGATGPVNQPDNTPQKTPALHAAEQQLEPQFSSVLSNINSAYESTGANLTELAQYGGSQRHEVEDLAAEQIDIDDKNSVEGAMQQMEQLSAASVATGNPSQDDVATAFSHLSQDLAGTTDLGTQVQYIKEFMSTNFPNFQAQ